MTSPLIGFGYIQIESFVHSSQVRCAGSVDRASWAHWGGRTSMQRAGVCHLSLVTFAATVNGKACGPNHFFSSTRYSYSSSNAPIADGKNYVSILKFKGIQGLSTKGENMVCVTPPHPIGRSLPVFPQLFHLFPSVTSPVILWLVAACIPLQQWGHLHSNGESLLPRRPKS